MAGKKVLDPRQIAFLKNYLDINSPLRGNAYQSAMAAGFSESYASEIMSFSSDWITDAMRKRELMLMKAERNLDEVLDLDPIVDAMGPFGPIIDKETGEPYKKLSMGILNIKHDASKFVAETVGKKFYSKRQEIGFIDPNDLKLTDKEKADIDAIFAENIKALPQA